jgi:predicted nucleotidyltransferase component of viral defense system
VSRVTRGTPSGDAYLDLQNEARRTGRPTQELLQLYVLEGFLARLAASDVRESFVLKGGVLLAAFDSRRPTKDVDLAGLNLANDTNTVLELVRRVLDVEPPEDDGIEFAADTATVEIIREEDQYSGIRVHVEARLASAKLPFHVDVNVGDPIWPEPTTVELPRLRGGAPIELRGYPIHMVHAEKIVTAVQRGIANTRWRDFGDIWSLSRCHRVDSRDLRQAIEEVARYRNATLRPLAEVLEGFAPLAQARWSQWRRRSNSDHLPEQFEPVLRVVIEFADPVLTNTIDGRAWDPETAAW